MVRKVALTGATGFVGSAVVPVLLKAGFKVSVLVRTPKPEQFPEQVKVVAGDLEDPLALDQLVKGADCVVHLAGAISALSEAQFFKSNFSGVQLLFRAAEAAQIKRFVHISSLVARRPELSAYAASKRAGEDFLQSTHSKMEIAILRPSAIYGPADKATLPLLAALQKRVAFIPGAADARFSLLYVRDFAEVISDFVASDATGVFEIDDLSGGYKWADLAQANVKISGLPKRIIYIPQSAVNLVAIFAEAWSIISQKAGMISRGKLRELYYANWVVQGQNWPRPNPVGLAEGLVETLEWYRSHGWLKPIVKIQEK